MSKPALQHPVRTPSASVGLLFPPDCIFCGKLASKLFPLFNDKDKNLIESWRLFEPRVAVMGTEYEDLYCNGKGKNLFAREADHYEDSLDNFNLKYLN